ncbi:hypothetical protein ACLOJK_020489 [Asimina triloba]
MEPSIRSKDENGSPSPIGGENPGQQPPPLIRRPDLAERRQRLRWPILYRPPHSYPAASFCDHGQIHLLRLMESGSAHSDQLASSGRHHLAKSIGSWSARPTRSRLHLISMATRISMDSKVGQRSSPIHRATASMENQAENRAAWLMPPATRSRRTHPNHKNPASTQITALKISVDSTAATQRLDREATTACIPKISTGQIQTNSINRQKSCFIETRHQEKIPAVQSSFRIRHGQQIQQGRAQLAATKLM